MSQLEDGLRRTLLPYSISTPLWLQVMENTHVNSWLVNH